MYNKGLITGTFDLFHYGHLMLLRQAKKHCQYLVVGIGDDETGDMRKEHRGGTIYTAAERKEMLQACRYVDEVGVFADADQTAFTESVSPDVCFQGAEPNWRQQKAIDTLNLQIPHITLQCEHLHASDIVKRIREL